MEETSVRYSPIGFFNSPFENVEGMPIQPVGGLGVEAEIDILPEYREGLLDLEGFSHIIVISHLHQVNGYDLVVKPFLDNKDHGIFATRSPKRPNPIGFSVMKLVGVTPSSIRVEGVDVVNGTPVIDIKPYVADFDIWSADRFGWFEGKSENATHHLSDNRFV